MAAVAAAPLCTYQARLSTRGAGQLVGAVMSLLGKVVLQLSASRDFGDAETRSSLHSVRVRGQLAAGAAGGGVTHKVFLLLCCTPRSPRCCEASPAAAIPFQFNTTAWKRAGGLVSPQEGDQRLAPRGVCFEAPSVPRVCASSRQHQVHTLQNRQFVRHTGGQRSHTQQL